MAHNQNYNPRIKHGKYHEFSQEEIAMAEEEFRRRGGLIRRLPEEAISRSINVLPKDIRNYSGYEPLGFNEPPVEAGERGE